MKTLHIVPHTHWDREWYMPFESHRYRLVELMDDLIETFDRDPNYTYFHMDGQVIPILDYLEIKPHMKDKVLKLIKEDRLQIGPWYILQDEYLISSEANVRNMIVGLKLSESLGAKPVMTGYFPDSFGNISQAPQILKGFGIQTAVFGRGLNEVGFNNEIISQKGINKSEVNWMSPDGSEVTCAMFANWYCNAIDLPVTGKENTERFEKIIMNASKFSHLDDLLGMNGCDHTPIQKDLSQAIKHAQETIQDVTIKHSNMKDYLDIVLKHKDQYMTVSGEIAGQLTKGYHLLINTASSRVDLKLLNHLAQVSLEKRAEPIASISHLYGHKYDSDYFLYAWKLLMENHPHDSICSCSVDSVHSEMKTRFDKVLQVSELVESEAFRRLSKDFNTKNFKGQVLSVFNPYPKSIQKPVIATIDFPKDEHVNHIQVFDAFGKEIPVIYQKKENYFTYDLPKDRFRQVTYVDRFELEFVSTELRPTGFTFFDVVKSSDEKIHELENKPFLLENDLIKVDVLANGSIDMFHKQSGQTKKGLNYYEYTLDIGNEYNYEQSKDFYTQTTLNEKAQITWKAQHDVKQVIEVNHHIRVPKGVVQGVRSDEEVALNIVTTYTLFKDMDSVDIKTTITNQAENFRIRAMFPHDIKTDKVYADGQFDLIERDIHPWEGWENPCNTQRFQAFVQMKDAKHGLQVAAQGLLEYEVVRQKENTLALTLLRGVHELGDWGIFPTPSSQMKGIYRLDYQVVLFEHKDALIAAQKGYYFNGLNLKSYQLPSKQAGNLNPTSLIEVKQDSIHMSALKKAENGDDLIARLYNIHQEKVSVEVDINPIFKHVYRTFLNEDIISEIEVKSGKIKLEFNQKEIITLKLSK